MRRLAALLIQMLFVLLPLAGCKDASVSGAASAGASATPSCTGNAGRGYGGIYQCAASWCAKNDSAYSTACAVDMLSPCVQQGIANEAKAVVNPSQFIEVVGPKLYFNVCPSSTGGKGNGATWACGTAQCAYSDSGLTMPCVQTNTGGASAAASALNTIYTSGCTGNVPSITRASAPVPGTKPASATAGQSAGAGSGVLGSSSSSSSGTPPGGGSYCKAVHGRGYGFIYQCGQAWCAKNDAGFTAQCVVNTNDPCVQTAIASDTQLQVDATQPIQSVGGKTYFNICPSSANSGQGYGTPWSCGVAKCAHSDSAYQQTCVISGTGGTAAAASDLTTIVSGTCG